MVQAVSGSDRWMNKNWSLCHGGLPIHWEAQPDATHIQAMERKPMHASFLPLQLIIFLQLFFGSKSRSRDAFTALNSSLQFLARLILTFEYFRFNIAFRAGTNLKTNRHITKQPETGMWWMWGQHCAVSAVQSVGNLRRSLLARTRVCQMFPFTSYNPLGHRQSTNLNCHVNTFFTELGKCFIFLLPLCWN